MALSPRLIIAAQMGVVVGLLGLVIYQARELAEAHRQLEAAALAVPEIPGATNQRIIRLRPPQLPAIQIQNQVQSLDWRHIESSDYPTYIANLRAIGCPEETIRDIILADIDQLFERRRLALQPPPQDWTFWQHPDDVAAAGSPSPAEQLRELQLAELERERRRLITRLLGSSALAAELDSFKQHELQSPSLQFLDPAKREAIADARARWRQALEESVAISDEEERAAFLAAARQELDDEMTSTLTPQEIEQYAMRESPLADRLREQLRGFQASREEFETLFRLERQLEDETARLRASIGVDPQAIDRLEAAELQFQQQVREELGPERYADYIRSSDEDYQTLYSLAIDHQVPATVANQVWEMRKAVEQQSLRIRENPLLTPEQKQLALDAIRNETLSAIVGVLGEPLLEEYQRRGGGWLIELTSPPELGWTAPVPVSPEAMEAPPPPGLPIP